LHKKILLTSQTLQTKQQPKAARKINEDALALFNKGDLTEAIKLFKDAGQVDKSDPEILNNLGYALIKQGNVESAKTAIVGTLVISPGRAQAWQNFGDILTIQGEMPKAIAAYENVYRYSKNRANTHKFMHKLNTNNDGGSALKDARQQEMDWAVKTFADENIAQAIQAQ
jgi:Flp pilus assembly protein TadD